MPAGVLQHHDGVVDHEARGDGQGHEAEVVEAEAQQIHRPEGAKQRDHGRHRRDHRRAHGPQEGRDHQDHQDGGDQERDLDFAQRRPDAGGGVGGDLQLHVAGQLRGQQGQGGAHLVDRLDDVGVGLLGDQHDDGGLAVEEPDRAGVLHAVDDARHVGQPDRRVVAIGDDQTPVVRRLDAAGVGVDLQPPAALVLHHALGPVGVGRLDRGAHVLQADPEAVQREGRDLRPHRRLRAAADLHVADAAYLRQALLHDVVDGVVDLAGRAGVGSQRQDDHRLGGRVHLAVGRVAVQRGRQVDAGGVDPGLHLAGRGVDVLREVELQADPRRAVGAGRGDLVDPGDGAEPSLQRRRDAGGHGLRARPGQVRLHRDRREIDHRQGRDRQHQEARDPGQGHADGQEHRGDRPADEGGREVHVAASGPGFGPVSGVGPASGSAGGLGLPRAVSVLRASRSNAR